MDVKVQSHQVVDGVTITLDGSDFQNEDTLKQAHTTIDNVFKDMSRRQSPKITDALPETNVPKRRSGHKFRIVISNLTEEQSRDLEELADRNGYMYSRSFM